MDIENLGREWGTLVSYNINKVEILILIRWAWTTDKGAHMVFLIKLQHFLSFIRDKT